MRPMAVVAVLLFLASFFYGAGNANAGVEIDVKNSLKLESAAIDTALSADGRRFYVLSEEGKVSVYNGGGRLEDTVELGKKYASLEVSPDGSLLYLTGRDGSAVDIVELSYMAQLDITGSPFIGPADAPVVITEFSDFQCPYCSRVVPVVEGIAKKYPKDVKVVFKFLPLIRIHKFAMNAAIGSLAAMKQGKFWEFHDEVFKNYNKLSDQKLTDIAKQIGLDMARFEKDKQDPEIRRLINRDMQEASRNNVRGTPTLFVNGRRLKNRSEAGFDEAIQRELRQLKK